MLLRLTDASQDYRGMMGSVHVLRAAHCEQLHCNTGAAMLDPGGLVFPGGPLSVTDLPHLLLHLIHPKLRKIIELNFRVVSRAQVRHLYWSP